MTTKLIAGRYQILEQLGQGGMAVVYKAYDTRLEREVAIKVIRQDAFPPEELEHILKRFEREAKLLGRLSHPGIVTILDYGSQDGVPFLVMEYISGKSLKDIIAVQENQRMLWQDAVKFLIPIAEALEHAHQQNVIHRDVKSSNILVAEDGKVMLVDFGISKMLASEGNTILTSTGAIVGTPDYMAPEQVSNTGIDHRADIYALGIVFYELVTGRKPYQGTTPISTLMKHTTDPLPNPKQFAPGLPDGVERMILKALAKKKEDRYQSMNEFIKALASGEEDELIRNRIPVRDVSDDITRDIHARTTKVHLEPFKTKVEKPPGQRMRPWIPIAVGVLIVTAFLSALMVFRKPLLGAVFPPTFTATASNAPASTSTQAPTPTATSTLTPIPTDLPTQTPTASLTPFPSATATPDRPMLYIDHPSFCRTGPSISFPDVTDFASGVILPILATNNQGWWLVEINLSWTKFKSCWIFGNTPMGKWQGVPIIVPTGTP